MDSCAAPTCTDDATRWVSVGPRPCTRHRRPLRQLRGSTPGDRRRQDGERRAAKRNLRNIAVFRSGSSSRIQRTTQRKARTADPAPSPRRTTAPLAPLPSSRNTVGTPSEHQNNPGPRTPGLSSRPWPSRASDVHRSSASRARCRRSALPRPPPRRSLRSPRSLRGPWCPRSGRRPRGPWRPRSERRLRGPWRPRSERRQRGPWGPRSERRQRGRRCLRSEQRQRGRRCLRSERGRRSLPGSPRGWRPRPRQEPRMTPCQTHHHRQTHRQPPCQTHRRTPCQTHRRTHRRTHRPTHRPTHRSTHRSTSPGGPSGSRRSRPTARGSRSRTARRSCSARSPYRRGRSRSSTLA